jgi:signal transduction histidine kinase
VLGPQIEQAGATIEIGDLPVVTADRARLGQVFQNLIANAVKFRRAELAVVVGVSATRDGPRTWRFEVTDNGIGIEERYRARIFRMFQRLHTTDVFPGTGIGLAVAERIVERHGGAIGVEASATGGSKFWFTLPEQAVDGGR